MQPTITNTSKLAIAAAIIFPIGGLIVLFGDSATHPGQWTIKHGLTVLTVAGTIAAGHLCLDAMKLRRALACIGFAVLFLLGTGLVVVQSIGRQVETSETKHLSAEATNAARATIQADMARAMAMRDEAAGKMARECASGYGKRCRGIQATLDVYTAAVTGHQANLAKLGPAVPVDPTAAHVAKTAAVFGFDATKVKSGFLIVEPFLITLFFEIGSVIALGFAMPARVSASRPTVSVSDFVEKTTPATSRAVTWAETDELTDDQLEALRKLIAKAGRPLNNNEVARLCNVRKGTASKWVSRGVSAGLMSRQRVGREVAISATLH